MGYISTVTVINIAITHFNMYFIMICLQLSNLISLLSKEIIQINIFFIIDEKLTQLPSIEVKTYV